MKPDAKKRLIRNIVGSMSSVPHEIQERQIRHFYKADPASGRGVGEMGLKEEEVMNGELAVTAD
jgi:catalase